MNNFRDKQADIKLIYKTVDGLNLPVFVYLPEGDIHKAKTVLLIHGGGWRDGIFNNSDWNGGVMAPNAQYLASKGFISVVISYRPVSKSNSLTVCDILSDCKDAIIFMRNTLTFIDFENIIYMGDSAGGYLTTMLGLAEDDNIRPKTVVSLNPVLDCSREKWSYAFNGCKNIEDYCPINIIGEKCSEFLFLHGTSDEIVEIEDTVAMDEELRKRGHKSEMIKVADAKHAFLIYDFHYPDEYVNSMTDKIIDYLSKN